MTPKQEWLWYATVIIAVLLSEIPGIGTLLFLTLMALVLVAYPKLLPK